MSIENVRNYLKQFKLDEKIREFEVSSATVELAAEAAGVIPARIAKTLSFATEEGAILIVAAGDAKVDNRKFKDTFSMKAKMLSPEDVIAFTGHAIGGVCPFAIPDQRVRTYLDLSLKRFETVLPAAGNDRSCVELTPEELEKASDAAAWVDVCKY